ncbi:hypothetical protein FIV36_02480 [Pseudomonas extremaustralis]|uniref:Uncharacterized protein n=1 Tax=Pseudomonas extremaustralis TaxID=359110 RepID=A0A5C5QN71_9PSED|nr:hypothetical protein FIV36_02480 [Pseudomonas extremaustralis]
MLAKNVNGGAGILNVRVVLGFFASKLAPTRGVAKPLFSSRRTAHPPVRRFSPREIALWMVFSCSNWSTA